MTTTTAPEPTVTTADAKVTKTDDEATLALMFFKLIPEAERKAALIDAQMAALGRQAHAFLSENYKRLTGETLSEFIILDGESGMFADPDDIEDDDEEDDEEDIEEDEDEDETEEVEPEVAVEKAIRPSTAVNTLRKWMKANEYSQSYVAKKLRVTQPAVSTWLAKTSEPRAITCKRIMKLCSK